MEIKSRLVMTPEQAAMVKLYMESGGRCVFTHKPCQGRWLSTSVTNCRWSGAVCGRIEGPLGSGELCKVGQTRDPGIPLWPCETVTLAKNRWQCDYVLNTKTKEFELSPDPKPKEYRPPCYSAIALWSDLDRRIYLGELVWGIPEEFKEAVASRFEGIESPLELKALKFTFGSAASKYPNDYLKILQREWTTLHRAVKDAAWQREQQALHDLGERLTGRHLGKPAPQRGQFSDVAKSIAAEDKPSYYIQTQRIKDPETGDIKKVMMRQIVPDPDTGRFIPVVKVELSASSTYDVQKQKWVPESFFVDISSALKKGVTVSKNAWNKHRRYGKPLPEVPEPDNFKVEELVYDAYKKYQARSEIKR